MSKSVTVSSLSGLYSALASAKGGETIKLAPGDYGDMFLGGKSKFDITFPSNVTITSADPNNPAVFSGLDVRGAANLTFDGVVFDYSFAKGDTLWERPFSVSGSQDITIRNCTFDGDAAKGVSEVDDGYGTGIGLSVRGCSDVRLEGNEIYNFYRGIVTSESDGIIVKGNDLHSMRMDGLNFAEVTDVVIEQNYIHDFKTSPTPLDHCDMIQFWTNGTDTPSSNIVIRDNRLDIGTGGATQSIFMRNDQVDRGLAGPEMFYRNVTIENNVIVNGHLHGIAVGETAGLTIQGNSVLRADGGKPEGVDASVEIPRIAVAASSTNVIVTHNATSGIAGYSGQTDWTVSKNAFVQDQDSRAPGWYGDVFVTSSLTSKDGVHDFVAVPGGILDRLGAGADLQASTGPDTDFHVRTHDTYLQVRIFDVVNPHQDLPKGAVWEWSFGDGTKATGAHVAHNFADGGAYDVTLTLRMPDGSKHTEAAEVEVQGLEVLKFGKDGVFHAYDAGHEIAVQKVATSADGLQLGAKGVTASIAREHVVDITGADDFTISMDLEADSRESAGEVFRLHGSIVATVTTKGELMLQVTPTVGAMVTLTTTGAKLNDLKSHDIDIRMDDGQMQVWVDGSMSVARDLAGPLANSGRLDLTFGNQWGKANFNGDLKSFEIEVGETAPFGLVADQTDGNSSAFYEAAPLAAGSDRFDFLDGQANVSSLTTSL